MTSSRVGRLLKGHFALLLLFLCLEVLFHGIAMHFGYHRYLFSAETLLAFCLFAMGFRVLGAVLLAISVLLELMLGMAAVFFLFEVDQLWDMAEFLFEARSAYLFALLALPLALVLSIWAALWIRKTAGQGGWLLLTPVLQGLVLFQSQWMLSANDDTFFTPTLAKQDRLLFGSTAFFFGEIVKTNRLETIGAGPDEHAEYVPLQHASAAEVVWGKHGLPKSSRVLLVVAEAWGQPKDDALLRLQIEALGRSPRVSDLLLDKVHAKGATAAGELRELCSVIPTRLNFRKMTPEKVGDCLPARLARLGYSTTGIHAAHGAMYRRTLWWPQVGLQKLMFKENLPPSDEACYSFPGYCDRNLIDVVKSHLRQERSFAYWLTLNSHMPYDRRDVVNYREEFCKPLIVDRFKEQLCNYQNLHAQFFEGLASLIDDPSMKGVEVVVVGDHPPLFNDREVRDYFSRDQVPMLHFTVK